jgi:hypothetical protein
MDKMQLGEIRKLPKSSSPMFTEQYAVQGAAKVPYIVSWKQGYKGNGYATEQQKAQEWQCSCGTTMCLHILDIQKHEKIIVVKPEKGHVVISEEEHEAYKKFPAARGTRKTGNNFDEEGRRFRP